MREITGVLSNTERHAQMQKAIATGFPFLQKRESFHENRCSLVCYGPSLLDTWRMVKPLENSIITVSGAHDFMVDRNIIATYHVEIDPRPHKAKMLRSPREETRYLMASCCHSDFWPKLADHDVQLWHLINGDDKETGKWVAEHHREGLASMIGGGSTVGLRAMNVAAALGFRRFAIFGMDCSFNVERHAGGHTGEPEPERRVWCGGRLFRTTPQLLQAAREMARLLVTMDVECEFYGDGLMQELARQLQKRKANA